MRVCHGIPLRPEAPVALTIGNFDGVHLGHQAMLAHLKEAAGRLGLTTCVVIFEPHPREFFAPDKAPTRLTSLREKLELLAAADVDRVQICRFNFDFARISAEDFIVHILQATLIVSLKSTYCFSLLESLGFRTNASNSTRVIDYH